jgi:hypothetical protein
MVNNICGCANGATNPTQCNVCPAGSNMLNGQCNCSNGMTPQSGCSQCPSGMIMDNNICVQGCSLTNICNQQVQGVLRNGICSVSNNVNNNINNSCINFSVNTSNVNPNGSADFSWKIQGLNSNVGSRCGFVDLTTPTPRPIPGLQNLDAAVDRVRISNIQTTTRFCLVCKFYNMIDQANLGDAVLHQWVRVIKIGEN